MADYSWSHFCYYPLITRGSAGRAPLVTLLLLSSHHPCVSWQSTLVTLRLLSNQHPCVSWQSTADHTSVTLQSSPVDQLAKYSWSHFCYSPIITRGSAGKAQLVTLLLLSSYHRVSAGRAHWSHFSYSPLNTRLSAGTEQLVTLLLLSTHHPWISWKSRAGHISVTLQSSPVDRLAKHSW